MAEATTTPDVEHEQDFKPSATKRKNLQGYIGLNAYDSTLNALVHREGGILGQMTHDGLNNLLAHARCSIGVKKGRYYFEVVRMDSAKHSQLRFGVSLSSAKFAGSNGSIVFDAECGLTINGEAKKGFSPQRYLTKGDVCGVLINLEAKHTNKNTVSLFVNGARHSQPVPLPENMVGQALFPHLAVKSMSAGLNLQSILHRLPFTVLMVGEATQTDIEKTKVTAPSGTPKAIFPIGTNTEEFVKKFLAKHPTEHFLPLTNEYMKEWCLDSKCNVRHDDYSGIAALDQPRLLAPLLRTRPRNIIFALGNLLFPTDREARLNALPGFEKEAIVVPTTKSAQVFAKYQEAAFPTAEEGFCGVTYEDVTEASASEQLTSWKKDQKLRSKVDDLKVGEYFTERHEQWTKFVTEKKVTDEGKQFSDEDWMLANARAELMAIIHAFKTDVNDEEQPSFPPQLAPHYYQAYLTSKTLNPHLFACSDVEELINEHLTDCIAVDKDTGLLKTLHDKDLELEKIFELVDGERDARETRVGAGDELSELKFSMKNPPRAQTYQSGKGKGYKGQKRGGGHHGPPAQRPRYS